MEFEEAPESEEDFQMEELDPKQIAIANRVEALRRGAEIADVLNRQVDSLPEDESLFEPSTDLELILASLKK